MGGSWAALSSAKRLKSTVSLGGARVREMPFSVFVVYCSESSAMMSKLNGGVLEPAAGRVGRFSPWEWMITVSRSVNGHFGMMWFTNGKPRFAEPWPRTLRGIGGNGGHEPGFALKEALQ